MTVIDTALRDHLRALKLSGMLETLDARLTQAHAGDLGHLDFLQVLCHDEITRRDTTSMQRRVRHARFEQQATLEEKRAWRTRRCMRSEEHTSELQSPDHLVCRLLLEKKKI